MSEVDIPGWQDVVDWFGFEPGFHDAEVVSIELARDPLPSFIRVHYWRTLDAVDDTGYFRQDRQALVTIRLEGIERQGLRRWNHQNVLSELSFSREDKLIVLKLEAIHGVEGGIAARSVSVSIEPAAPDLRADPAMGLTRSRARPA